MPLTLARRVALLVLLASACRAQVSPFPSNDWASLNDAGERAYERRQYAASENFLKGALQLAENFGHDDPRVATTLNDLALLYRAEGKLQDAEPLYRRSLAIREKKLGPSDPAVAVSLNNLAGLLAAENRYMEAEQKYRRALAIREKALGPN
ncbi:MAG: tetratricopeptide repeat protein, partial [Candidatus Acidiferrales bacterium]